MSCEIHSVYFPLRTKLHKPLECGGGGHPYNTGRIERRATLSFTSLHPRLIHWRISLPLLCVHVAASLHVSHSMVVGSRNIINIVSKAAMETAQKDEAQWHWFELCHLQAIVLAVHKCEHRYYGSLWMPDSIKTDYLTMLCISRQYCPVRNGYKYFWRYTNF